MDHNISYAAQRDALIKLAETRAKRKLGIKGHLSVLTNAESDALSSAFHEVLGKACAKEGLQAGWRDTEGNYHRVTVSKNAAIEAAMDMLREAVDAALEPIRDRVQSMSILTTAVKRLHTELHQ